MARLEGTDPTAPTLLLMGHTDVVPANPADWESDPFGCELVDGEVWGRGAVEAGEAERAALVEDAAAFIEEALT